MGLAGGLGEEVRGQAIPKGRGSWQGRHQEGVERSRLGDIKVLHWPQVGGSRVLTPCPGDRQPGPDGPGAPGRPWPGSSLPQVCLPT